ncbi:MAG: prenyltransferase [Anaerolineales bacterium]|nr:prenyltransferase [Anaerolineales bacterium]
MSKVVAFLRLSRPHFLGGGLLLYALGALIARYQGYAIDFGLYWLGQAFVSALQLMVHYLNEYWDVETDRLNQNRTPFSGGSGLLADGTISRETVFTAAVACVAVASGAAIWLILEYRVGPAAWALMALTFLGAYSYSSPPFKLMNTGLGEVTASITVAGLVPAMGHVLQAGRPSLLVVLATAPLVVYHFTMLLAFEFPDFLADEAAGKTTLLVRLGRRRGVALHNAALVLALALGVLVSFVGLPAQVALAVVISSPLALLQIVNFRRMQRGEPVSYPRLTLLALLIFALTAYFAAFNFWVLGG